MKKIFMIIGVFVAINFANAQSTKDFFVVPTTDSLAIYLTFSPNANTVYNVYRQTPQGFVRVNEKPIRVELEAEHAKMILGNDWSFITQTLGTDNSQDILLALKRNDFSSSVLSLVSQNAATVAGKLSWDSKQTGNQHYKIIFSSISGVKKDSLEKTVNTDFRLPKSPFDLKVENVNNQIQIKWNYQKWSGDYNDIGFHFNIYRKDGNSEFRKINNDIIVRDDNAKPNYDDVFLKIGEEYSYYVTIGDPVGNESKPSNIVKMKLEDVVAPGTVSGLQSTSTGKGLLLTWNMSPELDAKGYNIYRSKMATGKNKKLNKELISFDTPSFVDSTVSQSVQNFYKVSVVDTARNESEMSNAYAATLADVKIPDSPTNVVAKPVNGFVQLSWNKSAEKDLVGAVIYRGLDSNITARISVPTMQTTYLDSGYNNLGYKYGAKVHYYVSFLDSSKNESKKIHLIADVPDVEAPLLPTNFRVENKNGIYVAIDANASVSQDVAKYFIYRKEENGKQNLLREISIAPLSIRDSNVVKGKTYLYAISAIDKAGNKTKISDEMEVFVRDYNAPPIPRNVRAKFQNGSVNLVWAKVTDFDLVGYNVYRSNLPSGTFKKLNEKPITDLNYIDKTGNNSMFYRILSVDTSGNESKHESSIAVK